MTLNKRVEKKAKQQTHLRLPERSGLVRGEKSESGEMVKEPDPRTASQDPTWKRAHKKKT